MPTEPIAALLYLCLLLPGIAFIWQYEGHKASIKRSAFRETSTVVIASAASLAAVLVIYYIAALFSDAVRLHLRQLFIDPSDLFLKDSQAFFGLALLNLALATLFGAFFGSKAALQVSGAFWKKILAIFRKQPALARNQSAWLAAFERYPDHKVLIGVHLKGGAWVHGVLDTYSLIADEIPDRAFTLVGDLHYQSSAGNDMHQLENHAAVIVQASEVSYLTVGYQAYADDDDRLVD